MIAKLKEKLAFAFSDNVMDRRIRRIIMIWLLPCLVFGLATFASEAISNWDEAIKHSLFAMFFLPIAVSFGCLIYAKSALLIVTIILLAITLFLHYRFIKRGYIADFSKLLIFIWLMIAIHAYIGFEIMASV